MVADNYITQHLCSRTDIYVATNFGWLAIICTYSDLLHDHTIRPYYGVWMYHNAIGMWQY